MLKAIKKLFSLAGLSRQSLSFWCLAAAARQQGLLPLIAKLRRIVPDISNQELSCKNTFNDYWEFKRRALQAFQCRMMIKSIEDIGKKHLNIVDIGDSAGTHMLYLKTLAADREIETLSVNLDKNAIEKIRARGLNALLCRAEDLDLGQRDIDLFTSFQMIEHLHDPSKFFRSLAKRSKGNTMLVTLPYIKNSRVGLHTIRERSVLIKITAEEEHIFELSPKDWELLMRHSGWRVVFSKIYYQYPKNIPVLSQLLAKFWRSTDYEGFWGAILKKDTEISDRYADWGDI
ncbi:MAG: methyltransferase domain-containing protein [Candidatus Margulisiibacteriota bacterium]